MAEIKAVEIIEIYEKIGGIRTDINNCEELTDEKKSILRRNIRFMFEAIDVPDSFYEARERMGNVMLTAVLILFAVSAFLTQWISSGIIIGIWILFILIRARYLPSLDDMTIGVIKSGNHTLYRIFIKQNKQH